MASCSAESCSVVVFKQRERPESQLIGDASLVGEGLNSTVRGSNEPVLTPISRQNDIEFRDNQTPVRPAKRIISGCHRNRSKRKIWGPGNRFSKLKKNFDKFSK